MIGDIRRFIKHSLVYAAGNIANRVGAFLLLPLYTNYLTTSEYGMLEIFYTINVITASLLGFGFAHASLRFYFEYEKTRDRRKVISTSLIASFAISTIGVSLAIMWRTQLSLLLFDTADYADLFYIGFAIVILEISTQINFAYLRAREYSIQYCLITVMTMILQVVCNILTVGKFNMGVEGILIGNFIAICTSWMVVSWWTISECGLIFDLKMFKELVFYSYPMLLGMIIGAILVNADRFILKSLGSLGSVGIYALSLKLGSIIRVIFLDPFQRNFGPYRFSIMKRENAKQIYSQITSYMLFGVIYLGLGVSMFSDDVLRLMSKQEYWQAAKILPIVCLGLILGSLTYPFQTGILISKQTKYLFYISTITGIIALLLNFILVPYFGALGCAVAGLLAATLTCLITFVISQRIFYVKYDFVAWGKTLLIAGFIYFASLFLPRESILFSISMKSLLTTVFPIGMYYSKCFSPEEIESLKQYRDEVLKWSLVNGRKFIKVLY
jgi:O-antigen/teichoic acid export membrane protein